MPRSVTEYRCLLISPSDVNAERDALTSTVERWNAQIGNALEARVNLVRWESHSVPDMADEPQNVLNEQIVDECDLGIALFWSRVGTPTSEHPSGSMEEIHRLLNRGAKVMVYLKTSPIPQAQIDLEQLDRLKEIKAQFFQKGVLGEFDTISDLTELVLLHLTSTISARLTRERSSQSHVGGLSTDVLARPNVRVRAQCGVTANPFGKGTIDILGISVENHSTIPVYLNNIAIQTNDERMLVPRHDSLTLQPQTRRTLQPGQRFTINLMLKDILSADVTASQLVHAFAVDEIGRTYDSDPTEFRHVIETLLAVQDDHG